MLEKFKSSYKVGVRQVHIDIDQLLICDSEEISDH